LVWKATTVKVDSRAAASSLVLEVAAGWVNPGMWNRIP
jgi:hypothetical protein